MIPRNKMPQIPSHRMLEFVEFLGENGVTAVHKRLPIVQLRPIQQHVNWAKVEGLKAEQIKLSTPVIVSKKGYILDGHHRWIARKELDPNGQIICIVCDCPISKLFELGHEFEYSYTKSVHESVRIGRIAEAARTETVRTKAARLFNVDLSGIDMREFLMGMRVEQEHDVITHGDPHLIAQIAIDHLREIPDYYSKLKKYVENNG